MLVLFKLCMCQLYALCYYYNIVRVADNIASSVILFAGTLISRIEHTCVRYKMIMTKLYK